MENLRNIDLNLLPVLKSLIETQSVSRTANELNLSSPSVSRALGKLRASLNDELLVRSGQSLVLTPRAASIHKDVCNIIHQVEALVIPVGQPDISSVVAQFRIRCDDAFAGPLSACLFPCLIKEAPNISLEIIGDASPMSTRNHEVDLELGGKKHFSPETVSKSIGTGRINALVSRQHPILSEDISIDNFLKYPHVLARVQLEYEFEIKEALKGTGLDREVNYVVPGFFSAAAAASMSHMVATMPSPIATYLSTLLPIELIDVPIDLPKVPISMAWHVKHRNDAVHKWLRDKVSDFLKRIIEQR